MIRKLQGNSAITIRKLQGYSVFYDKEIAMLKYYHEAIVL